MIIKSIDKQKEILKIISSSDEESFFSLLKDYLQKEDQVDIVGVYKPHHLKDDTEFFLKVTSKDANKVLKSTLKRVKKELEEMKI